MSGIVGILNTDGAPVDPELLRRMTASMAYRGPDAQEVWASGHVGFGHAMLRTTREQERERQPYSADGAVWVVADARVDGRGDLSRKLEACGRDVAADSTDAELILHAYMAWGRGCVDHLLGDFAFAVWDGRDRSLFCARDHFGVKPFYLARARNCLVFGNTLDCLRLHPGVSGEFDELAVGDFLVHGYKRDTSATIYADVKRLPPAHRLTWSGGAHRQDRFWSLPVDGRIRYRRAVEYVEHFGALFREAVGDRLRADRIGVLMSGGLDSTAIAATAHELLSGGGARGGLRAYTSVFDRLFPDEEREYAGQAARAIGIPVEYLAADDYRLYERWDRPDARRPEPIHDPLDAVTRDQFRRAASHSRVVLSGFGGDEVLFPERSYLPRMMKERRFGRILADVGWYFWAHGRLPRVGFRTSLRRRLGRRPPAGDGARPDWLDAAFARRLDLLSESRRSDAPTPRAHPLRPEAYQVLSDDIWPQVFEAYDLADRERVEVRFPLLDVRLVSYLLSIPPVPWCVDKELLRAAMRGVLPDSVRLRPKTPLPRSPVSEVLREGGSAAVPAGVPAEGLAGYVKGGLLPDVFGGEDPQRLWVNLRPLTLYIWLRQSGRMK
jgi:asparagine synthase (glutamine-hydrolysing)